MSINNWHPADEKHFIRQLMVRQDGLEELEGYLRSIDTRTNWGPHITKADILDFKREAVQMLIDAKKAEDQK